MNANYVRPVIEDVRFLLDVENTQPFAIRGGLLCWTLNDTAEFFEPPRLCALCGGEAVQEDLGLEEDLVTIVRGGETDWDWAVLHDGCFEKILLRPN